MEQHHLETHLNDEMTTEERAKLGVQFQQRQLLERIARQLYDHSNPVDEWSSSSGVDIATGSVEIMPDYEIPERIESITASLPVGITSAVLQLGQRYVVLYSGPATVVQTLINLNDLGMILGRNDKRVLTLAGVLTSGYYINLAGHCLERTGNQ